MKNTTAEPISIVNKVRVVSTTKDSVHVGWNVQEKYLSHIQGYKIQYQAEGSSIIQKTQRLDSDRTNYDIQNLHENTYYKMCVHTYTNLNTSTHIPCVRATTSVDSLHVALGSTFGAFIALGIIVLFVFLAKWQNTRRLKKHLRNVTPASDNYDSMAPNEGDIELSDVSVHANDGQPTKTNDAVSQSSQVSGYHSIQSRKSIPSADNNQEDQENRRGSHGSHNRRSSSSPNPPALDPPPGSKQNKMRKQKSTDSQRSNPGSGPVESRSHNNQQNNCNPNSNAPDNQKRDYGGARPKEFSQNDPRNLYANQAYMDIPGGPNTGMRPNLSCKW